MEAAAQIDKLQDMFGEEDLSPELTKHLREHDSLGQILHHPLIIQIPYFPGMNRLSNRQLEHKNMLLKESVASENWDRYVFVHERPYRIEALQRVLWEMNATAPDVVWPLIGSVWIDSENISEYFDDWLELWDQDIPNRHLCMDDAEQAALKALPATITIYRGFGHDVASHGQSWTTDREKAVWFANRYQTHGGRQPMLATATIKKSKVIAYFLGRNESEIVVNPDDLMNVDTQTL